MTVATPAQDQAKTAISAAKAVVTSLQLALKMFTLYAEDHAYCQKSIVRLHGDIEVFLTKFGSLVLEIRSDCLLYEGETVHEGASKDGDLAFALFRDGMLEIVFLKGIEPEETGFLVKTIDRYRSLATTAEGDIVTALWEARLPHVYYVAADNILEVEQGKQALTHDSTEFQFPELPDMSLQAQSPDEDQSSPEGSLEEVAKKIEFKPTAPTTLQLTTEEADHLEEMVRSEEERDATQEIMDMMGDILKDQQDEEFFAYILEYMLEEFSAALKEKDFNIAFRIMQTLHQVRKLSEESKAWALARVQGFFTVISQAEFLETLKEILPTLSAAQIKSARKVLGLLTTDAVLGLGPLIVETPGPAGEMLSEILVSLASRDIRPMEQLLDAAEEPLVFHLAPLLGRIDGKKSGQMLLKLARYPSERVRMESLRAIIQRKLWVPEKMGFLLGDDSNLIRRLAIKYLGARKSEAAEGLLSAHIKNGKFDGDESGELIACFKALGKCGTGRSLPFLKDTLLKGGWISRFRSSTLRQGAALALSQFGTEQSLQVLEEAVKSPFPAVRSAARAVYQEETETP
jgi:predicted transcriptional regulator